MKLSHIHKQDLLSLAYNVFNQQSQKELTIKLAEKYGYKSGYLYIDLNTPNKARRRKILLIISKSLTKYINPLKLIKSWKIQK